MQTWMNWLSTMHHNSETFEPGRGLHKIKYNNLL